MNICKGKGSKYKGFLSEKTSDKRHLIKMNIHLNSSHCCQLLWGEWRLKAYFWLASIWTVFFHSEAQFWRRDIVPNLPLDLWINFCILWITFASATQKTWIWECLTSTCARQWEWRWEPFCLNQFPVYSWRNFKYHLIGFVCGNLAQRIHERKYFTFIHSTS